MFKFYKKRYLVLLLSLVSTDFVIADEENKTTFGFGFGVTYNGLGMMYGLKSDSSIQYLSVGCPSIGIRSFGDGIATCGAGLGYISADIFDTNTNKHALGIHLGASFNETNGTEVFISPQYIYFSNGINNSGFNYGANLAYGSQDGETKLYPGLQLGYQY